MIPSSPNPTPSPSPVQCPHPWSHITLPVLLSSLFSGKRFSGEENLRCEVLPCTTHHQGVQRALPAGGRTKHACITRSPAAPLLKGPRTSNLNQAHPATFSSCVSARFSSTFSSRALQCHEHCVLPIPQPAALAGGAARGCSGSTPRIQHPPLHHLTQTRGMPSPFLIN